MTHKMGKVEQFILDLAVYEEEPLHVLISAVIGEGLCASPDDIVEPLITVRDGRITVPASPGIGHALRPEAVRRYRVREETFGREGP